MNIIVAVDENWAIGYKNNLLIKIREDMIYFKNKTIGNNVIMGRKTFESLPQQKPLKDRLNIVLTRDDHYATEGILICKTIPEVIETCKKNDKETFVIGGEQIYNLFLPYCQKAYITKIYSSFVADKYFPRLDQMDEWYLDQKSEIMITPDGVKYQFCEYNRM